MRLSPLQRAAGVLARGRSRRGVAYAPTPRIPHLSRFHLCPNIGVMHDHKELPRKCTKRTYKYTKVKHARKAIRSGNGNPNQLERPDSWVLDPHSWAPFPRHGLQMVQCSMVIEEKVNNPKYGRREKPTAREEVATTGGWAAQYPVGRLGRSRRLFNMMAHYADQQPRSTARSPPPWF